VNLSSISGVLPLDPIVSDPSVHHPSNTYISSSPIHPYQMSSEPRPLPTYLYKIIPDPIPLINNAIPHTLPLSSLDATDGFIHLSNAAQIPITAGLFFGTSSSIWLLRVSVRAALEEGGVFKWLDDGETGCIHLYGDKDKEGTFARLGRGVVVDTKEYVRREGATWAETFKELDDGWLVDGP